MGLLSDDDCPGNCLAAAKPPTTDAAATPPTIATVLAPILAAEAAAPAVLAAAPPGAVPGVSQPFATRCTCVMRTNCDAPDAGVATESTLPVSSTRLPTSFATP